MRLHHRCVYGCFRSTMNGWKRGKKCKSFTISDALRESIRRVVTTPMKPLLYPVDRKDQNGEEKKLSVC